MRDLQVLIAIIVSVVPIMLDTSRVVDVPIVDMVVKAILIPYTGQV